MSSVKWWHFEIYILRFLNKLGIKEDNLFFLITIAVGALCGLIAVSFRMLIDLIFTGIFEVNPTENLPYLRFLLAPTLAGLLAGFVLKYLVPDAEGSGIPQTKAALFARGGVISFKSTVGKYLLSALCIGGGHSVGREGPTVHITSGVASFIGQKFYYSRDRIRALVPVGAAAGLAAAFNTPLAAVTFTIEEIVGNFNANILGSAVLAAVAACVVERSIYGNMPVFSVPAYSLVSHWELLFYVFLGITAGLVSVVFVNGLLCARKFCKERLPAWSKAYQPAVGGLTIGLMAFVTPKVLGVGYDTVNSALLSKLTFGLLALLIFFKLASTIISYASGVAGGIFAPALFIGAMVGGTVGYVVHNAFPHLTAEYGAYALVGMGAVFAGIIRAPMTSVIIIFEMTYDYSIIIPLMIANLISFVISRSFHKKPIYEALALQDGIHLPSESGRDAFKELTASFAMIKNPETIRSDDSIVKVTKEKKLNYHVYPVVDKSNRLLGVVSVNAIKRELVKKQYQKLIITITDRDSSYHSHPDTPIDMVMTLMGKKGLHTIPIVDRTNVRKLLGTLSLGDIFRAYKLEQEKDEGQKKVDEI